MLASAVLLYENPYRISDSYYPAENPRPHRHHRRDPTSVTGMAASAEAGTGGGRVTWFVGASGEDAPGIVAVVVLENGALADAWRIGEQALAGAVAVAR